jgi:hypothetical protein
MTDRRESHYQDEYRLIFLDAESRAIFVDPGGEQLHLPRVAIPRGSRTARELQQAIKDKWRVDAIILEFIPSAVGNFTAAIVEIEASAHYEGLTQACIDDISQDELDSESRALAESISVGGSSSGDPFSRLGWMKEARQWLATDVDPNLLHSTNIRQYSAGGTFALVRFDTCKGPSYWLKATGYPNERESSLTGVLASHFEN